MNIKSKSKIQISFLILLFFIFIQMNITAAGSKKELRNKIIDIGKSYLGSKYKYGASGKSGFDCSGFVMHVYRQVGINLPRMSKNQYKFAKKISLEEAFPGDVLFFKIDGKIVSHVAIYLGDKKFLHSPSSGKRVSVATLDNKYWKKRFFKAATFFK